MELSILHTEVLEKSTKLFADRERHHQNGGELEKHLGKSGISLYIEDGGNRMRAKWHIHGFLLDTLPKMNLGT